MNMFKEKMIKEAEESAERLFASLAYTDVQFEPLTKNFPMTKKLLEHCLRICVQEGNIEQYNKLRNNYPEFLDDLLISK